MRLSKALLIVMLFLLSASVFAQTDIRLLDNNTINTFIQEISGERAKDYVLEISKYHRIRGGGPDTDYEKAALYIESELRNAGIEDVTVFRYLSDGIKKYGTWPSPVGFRVKSGKLYMTEPVSELWCDFSETAVSLMAYSNGGNDEGEVVFVGSGLSDSDYEGKDVRGKIVFAERSDAASLMRKAVLEKGALGIIMGFSGRPDRYQFPDLVENHRISITGEEAKRGKWGFALSYRQTERLKRILDSGRKVVMRAEVDAELFAGHMPVVSATIPGAEQPEKEVFFMGHLDHYKPGANDNASGSAGMLEIIKVLKKLIDEKKIDPPKRTLRFLWVPEAHGTAAFIENNPDIVKRGILGINLDMIGEDYEKCNGVMVITSTPLAIPSFLDALIEHFVVLVDRLNIRTAAGRNFVFNYRIRGYSGGSDHIMFNDPEINVPSIMIVHGDHFHHSSYDTPDKVDPTEMKRSMLLGLFTGWTAANYDENNIKNLIELVFNNLVKKSDDYSLRYMSYLKNSENSLIHKCIRDIRTYYDILKEYGSKDFDSILANVQQVDINIIKDNISLFKAYVDIQKTRLNNYYRELCRERGIRNTRAYMNNFEKECSEIYPKRIEKMPLSWEFLYGSVLGDNIRNVRQLNYEIIQELLNFINGKSNLIYLRNAVSAEFREVDLETVRDLFEELKKAGIVTW
ncbi:DUF4910 domain-containing protein [candidate division KSB1 bacterium]